MEWKKLLSTRRVRELSGGVKSDKSKADTRNEIHRDYGRAVFATPVRRLQDKAQVFPLEPIDAVRTRLTHSLEVSSMAKGLANGIARELMRLELLDAEQAYNIETIAATCGLLHDIGNPPFGHFGEKAISGWFRAKADEFWNFDISEGKKYKNDLIKFEGNAQTLRLLSKLQVLSDRHGLNLTAATFSALCKYTASSLQIEENGRQSKRKLGYFNAEQNVIDLVREETGTGDARNPIAVIVEASDDMVYNIVDIEDAIKKGVIRWEVVEKVIKDKGGEIGNAALEKAKKSIDKSTLPLTSGAKEEGTAQYFRTFLMVQASEAVRRKFIEMYDGIMAGSYDVEVLYESDAGPVYLALKDFATNNVYNSKEVLRLELLGFHVIDSLLTIFSKCDKATETKTFAQKAYALMSQNYRMIYENVDQAEANLPDEYRKALLLTDFVCGMTDTYALNLHQQLTNG